MRPLTSQHPKIEQSLRSGHEHGRAQFQRSMPSHNYDTEQQKIAKDRRQYILLNSGNDRVFLVQRSTQGPSNEASKSHPRRIRASWCHRYEADYYPARLWQAHAVWREAFLQCTAHCRYGTGSELLQRYWDQPDGKTMTPSRRVAYARPKAMNSVIVS
jgi:hypothetical protein